MYLSIQAGFLPDNKDDQYSTPTCKATFEWTLDLHDHDGHALYITPEFAIVKFNTQKIIPQHFVAPGATRYQDNCSSDNHLPLNFNPYYRKYDPKAKFAPPPPQAKDLSFGTFSNSDPPDQPISYLPPDVPADGNPLVQADRITSSIANFGNPYYSADMTSFAPVGGVGSWASLDANFNPAVGSSGGDLLQSFHPTNVKRGKPVSFRA